MTAYRIKKGVRPYGGRVLSAVSESAATVSGFVQLGGGKVATVERLYQRDELTEL